MRPIFWRTAMCSTALPSGSWQKRPIPPMLQSSGCADGQMTALVMTSGLHHGKDHEAVVKALCTVQKKPMPAYHGPLV